MTVPYLGILERIGVGSTPTLNSYSSPLLPPYYSCSKHNFPTPTPYTPRRLLLPLPLYTPTPILQSLCTPQVLK